MIKVSSRVSRAAAPWSGAITLVSMALLSPAFGQEFASWTGGGSTWSNPNNWQCADGQHCVPNGDFGVTASDAGLITVDIPVSIDEFDGTGTTSLSLTGTSFSITGNSDLPGGLEVDNGILATNATINTAHTNGVFVQGTNSFAGTTLTASDLFLDNGSLATSGNSTLNTNLTVIGNHGTATANVTNTTWNFVSPGSSLILGQSPGVSGTMTLGTGAVLNFDGSQFNGGLLVGGNGHGVLTMTDGATITSQGGIQISIGDGQMTMSGGASAKVASFLVGYPPGGTSALNVQGEGTLLTLGTVPSGGMTVLGGTVTVSEKAQVTGGILGIDSGNVTVDSEANWTVADTTTSNDLFIGLGTGLGGTAPGVLTVQGGGTGSNLGDAVIGLAPGAEGSFVITGNESEWNVGGALYVGELGTGALNVAAGGALTTGKDSEGVSAYIGQSAASIGTATIEGDGTDWTAHGTVQVGAASTGTPAVPAQGDLQAQPEMTSTLEIKDQAEVHVDDDVSVGVVAESKGVINMMGGTLAVGGTLTVGDAGNGTLTAFPAAADDEADISSVRGVLGAQVGSNGSVTLGSALGNGLQPTSAQWKIQQSLVVGQAGIGSLDLGGTLTDSSAIIAQQKTANGDVTVENGGEWTTTGNLIVGDQGQGSLEILNGGMVHVFAGSVLIGNQNKAFPSSADVLGQCTITEALTVGFNGAATLKIEQGGTVASGDAFIAENAGSQGAVTVTDANSLWTANGTLYAGDGGTGTLNVQNGGQVTSNAGTIGGVAGGTGTVTVSGTASSWTVNFMGAISNPGDGLLTVGDGGTGTLTVNQGGQVQSLAGLVGNSAASSGTVSLTDAGTSWSMANDLVVAEAGSGVLSVSSGAALSNANANIGHATGSVGSVTVGSGGTWTQSGALSVGTGGQGTLAVSGGGTVTDTMAFIAQNPGSVGAATLTNAGSQWSTSGLLTIGAGGNGSVTVSNGAALKSGTALLGRDAHSTGAVTITGTGSTWADTGMLTVGSSGAATLTINSGGTLTSASAILGDLGGSTATASLDGSGSSWSNPGPLTIANSGAATLRLTGGAQVHSGAGFIASQVGSNGSVILTDQGSSWQSSGNLSVGSGGTATLTASNGAHVVDAAGMMGMNAGSSGTATITGTGSLWTNTGPLTVGGAGSGLLDIAAGGSVVSSAASIADAAGSNSTVAIDGSGSSWNSGALALGNGGTGALNLTNAAALESTGVNIGAEASSQGSANLSHSQWTAGTMIVGVLGTGSVTLNQSALSSGTVIFGSGAGASGQASLQAGSSWNAGAVTVGAAGQGTLNVASGSFASTDAVIGSTSTGTGTVSIGPSGQWTANGLVTIGANGSGALTVDAGGSVEVGGNAQVASGAGSTGSATIAGSWNVDGSLLVGSGGGGVVSVQDGGQLSSSVGVIGGTQGSVFVDGHGSSWTATSIAIGGSGGSALLKVSNGGTVSASQVTVGTGGTLAGQGVVGNVTNNGGVVTPTDGPGVMSIAGNFTQNSGQLVFDIDGTQSGQFDQLLVSQLAHFNGGSIDIRFGPDFVPSAGDFFQLILASGGLIAGNVGVDVSGLPGGFSFADVFGPTGLSLALSSAPVPLPGALELLLLGLGGVALVSRRSRRVACSLPARGA